MEDEKTTSIQTQGARKVDSSYCGQSEEGRIQNLTSSESALYYYLLSISLWNAEVRENHYFVSKKNVNKTEIAKKLGIGKTTIFRAFANLKNKSIIKESDKYYYIRHPRYYAYIGQKTLAYLINFFPVFGPDIIRVCALMYHWEKLYGKEGLSVSDVVEMLGQSRMVAENRKKVRAILSFLHGEGFIEYYITTEGYNGITFPMYHITGTHLRSENLLIDFTSQEGGALKEKLNEARRCLEESGKGN